MKENEKTQIYIIGVFFGIIAVLAFLLFYEHLLVFNPEYEVCTKTIGTCSMANIHYPVGRHKYCTLDTVKTKTCCDCAEWRPSNGRPEEKRDYRFVGNGWLN